MHPKKEEKVKKKRKEQMRKLTEENLRLRATSRRKWLRLMYFCLWLAMVVIGLMFIGGCLVLLKIINIIGSRL